MTKIPKYSEFVGAIYDVDDTLLNNFLDDGDPYNIHERSRLSAVHRVGEELGLPILKKVTAEDNRLAFREAHEHTVDAAVWNILTRNGLITDTQFDPSHPLVQKIIDYKAAEHAGLLELASEVRGSSNFVDRLERNQLEQKQAVASGARHEEISAFFARHPLLENALPRSRRIARGDFTRAKPHPEPFDRAFALLGLPDTPEVRRRVLFFEDDPKGIESGLRAGMFACALTTRFPADAFLASKYKPNLIAADFVEYANLLRLPN